MEILRSLIMKFYMMLLLELVCELNRVKFIKNKNFYQLKERYILIYI